ncbi:hypothetical protein [Leucobacter sp.]
MSTNLQNPDPEDLGASGNDPLIDPAPSPEQPRIDEHDGDEALDHPAAPAAPDQEDPDAVEPPDEDAASV